LYVRQQLLGEVRICVAGVDMNVASGFAEFLKISGLARVHVNEIESVERRHDLQGSSRAALDLLLRPLRDMQASAALSR
jgi:hypothetical protein